MKYDDLLQHRQELLQAAKLANLAYAHQWLGEFADRVARVNLGGQVILRGPDEEAQRPGAELEAQDFSQSVVEEHFVQDEINELHTVLAYVHEADRILEARFALEEIGAVYVPALRRVLQLTGVLPMKRASSVKNSKFGRA